MQFPFKGLVIFLASCAVAEAQSSLTTSEAGCGGRQSASAIVIDGEVGFGGLASVSPATVKSGFAGQLYDISSFTISATSSTNVNEGALVTLSARAGLDDSSSLAVAATNVGWPAGNFPLGYFLSGSYLGLSVYQDTAGAVTGSYLGLQSAVGVTVLDVDYDNYATAPYNFAFDGIPDSWQATNFPVGSTNAAPTADSDGDGSGAMAEYFFNTDPTSSSSSPSNAFRPTIVTNAGQLYFAATIYHRESHPPLDFHPQVVGDLKSYAWTSTPVLFSQATNGSGMVTDIYRDVSAATNSSPRFMRVFLEPAQD
jgi:hypothetical protein